MEDIGVRKYMIEDLEENYIYKGVEVKEVIELLGKPKQKSSTKLGYRIGDKVLGTWDWYSIEVENGLVK